MVLFWTRNRLVHPENWLFSLCRNLSSGLKYPKSILFNFENRSTGPRVAASTSSSKRQALVKLLYLTDIADAYKKMVEVVVARFFRRMLRELTASCVCETT